jgi:hypothetical protein
LIIFFPLFIIFNWFCSFDAGAEGPKVQWNYQARVQLPIRNFKIQFWKCSALSEWVHVWLWFVNTVP